jgi:ectoine hydroxylase-related dioxygenase (phytanoyl-CoA dioxygenase family)
VNAGWCLADQRPGYGGFIVLPGSQRANIALPSDKLDKTIFEHTLQLDMRRGDVLLFSGGAVTHGALPWTAQEPRRQVIVSYKAAAIGEVRSVAWANVSFASISC